MTRPDRGSWWLAEIKAVGVEPRRLAAVASTRHPDGARVSTTAEDLTEADCDNVVCWATYDDSGEVTNLLVPAPAAPKAPPLWFLELRESNAHPPAVNLLAFTGHGMPPGALLDRTAFSNHAVDGTDQLGAIRWYPATGEIDQIYVTPAMRRHSIATALLTASATLAVARGWPRFWSDGQRTELGEQIRNAGSWWHRAADLTHVAPPMTPTSADTPLTPEHTR